MKIETNGGRKLGHAPIVNPKDTKRLLKTDKIFARIHKQYGPPPNWTRPQGFITLSKIILEQQVSLASAAAHFIKLESFLPEFSPTHILQLSDEEMRRCQISRQKTAYLRALSNAILQDDIDLSKLSSLDEAEVRKQLTAIKGIGHWTADIYLMFCLQAKDIFPAGDIAVINTVKELSGAKTKEEIIQLAEKWKPYRSLATYYLWHYYLRKRNRQRGKLPLGLKIDTLSPCLCGKLLLKE
jgi:DNA-3-methyladenine glycosylase II